MVEKIISAYSCMGKSTIAQKAKEEGKWNFVDLDSSGFSWVTKKEYTPDGEEVFYKERNPEFVEDYFKAIKELYDDESVHHIFISTHPNIRQKLIKEDMKFTTVVPTLESKKIVLERMRKRGDSTQFINMMSDHYEQTLKDIKDSSVVRETYFGKRLEGFFEFDLVSKNGEDNGLFLYSNPHKSIEKTVSNDQFLIYEFAYDIELEEDVKDTLKTCLYVSALFSSSTQEMSRELDSPIEDVIEETGRWSVYGYKIYAHPSNSERFLREDYDRAATEMQEDGESYFSEVRKVVELREVISYV